MWTLSSTFEINQPIDVIIDDLEANPNGVFWGETLRVMGTPTAKAPRRPEPPAG